MAAESNQGRWVVAEEGSSLARGPCGRSGRLVEVEETVASSLVRDPCGRCGRHLEVEETVAGAHFRRRKEAGVVVPAEDILPLLSDHGGDGGGGGGREGSP